MPPPVRAVPVPTPVPGPTVAATSVPAAGAAPGPAAAARPATASTAHHAPAPAPHLGDPPIYTAMLHLWASHGRTLPGHRDQEWSRLAAGPVWADRTVRVNGTLVRQGDAR
ncbi:hypothetical protein [Streptomyces sp. NPDC126499]|uniref:hypothetical protein n=1 Tax=Streptomyces sp. NPDC126499 TaxID=3155314 RepID=UPI0033215354